MQYRLQIVLKECLIKSKTVNCLDITTVVYVSIVKGSSHSIGRGSTNLKNKAVQCEVCSPCTQWEHLKLWSMWIRVYKEKCLLIPGGKDDV